MNLTAAYTDLYQLTMAQVYFHTKPTATAVFDYYFRKIPFNGGYVVFAGLENVLDILEDFTFTDSDMEYLHQFDFDPAFLDYLSTFRFQGSVFSCREGDVVFPNRPILQVEANIMEAQIVETMLLNILNFQTLVATKASRMRHTSPESTLIEMGLRRAHATGGYFASRAAMIGGFDGTSNVKSAKDFDLPCSGTMAHSFIQSYVDELEAFRDFAKIRPNKCVLLIDTYNTLKSGLPNAITIAKEMESRGQRLFGIRLDSGDLAYLAKKSRQMLDAADLEYVKIVASNQLDEYVINSLKEQEAPIDVFGVGTNLVTGQPDASLGGVYKLSEFNGLPRIKVSENSIKISIPSKKQVYRIFDNNGMFYGADAITLASEEKIDKMMHPFDPTKKLVIDGLKQEPLLEKVVENGKRLVHSKTVSEIASYSKSRLDMLPTEYKRLENPHIYKIGLSPRLKDQLHKLIDDHSF